MGNKSNLLPLLAPPAHKVMSTVHGYSYEAYELNALRVARVERTRETSGKLSDAMCFAHSIDTSVHTRTDSNTRGLAAAS